MRKSYQHLVTASAEEVILLDIKCTKCNALLTLDNWTVGARKQFKKYCNSCSNQISTQWKKDNPEKVKLQKNNWTKNNKDKVKQHKANLSLETIKKHRLKSSYNLSIEDFYAMYEESNKSCSICNKPLEIHTQNKSIMACVDHDHVTGKVRGILCNGCNRGIGFLQDSPTLLNKAAEYLFKYKET